MAFDPTLLKSFTPSTITPGGRSTLKITIINYSTGNQPFNLVDIFPAGIVVAPAPNMINPFGGVVTGNLPGQGGIANPLTITGGTLPAKTDPFGTSYLFSIDVVSSVVGTHVNTVDADFYTFIAQVQAQGNLIVTAPVSKRKTRFNAGVLCIRGVEGNNVNYRGTNYQRLKDGECIFIPTTRTR